MFEENNAALEARLDAKFDAKLLALESRLDVKLTDLESRLDVKLTDLESRLDVKLVALEHRLELKMEYMLKGMRISLKAEMQEIPDQRFDALYSFLNDHFDKFVLKSEIRPECLKSS